MTLSVVVVDDHELVRGGPAMMVNAQPDMRVAAQRTGAQTCQWLRSSTADVVLMDVRMPVMEGVAVGTGSGACRLPVPAGVPHQRVAPRSAGNHRDSAP